MDSAHLDLLFKFYQNQHKFNPITVYGKLAEKRRDETQKNQRNDRLRQYDCGRQLPPAEHREPSPELFSDKEMKAQERKLKLYKWKEEKEKKLREMLLNKKKPFLSAVAPKASIPLVPPPIPSKAGPSENRRVTRSQANKNKEKEKKKVETATLPEKKPKSAMSLRMTSTPLSTPHVPLTRARARAREEMKMNIQKGVFDEDASHMEDVRVFRLQLSSEISRLTQLSDLWENVMKDSELPAFAQEQILSAVGLARLLMSSKMKMFEGLMTRCEERDVSNGLITPADLQGFWDMVVIQITEVDVRFKKLDQLKSSNWEEVKVVPQKKNLRPAKPKPPVQSKLKEVIAARRKANKQVDICPDVESKTFEGGFLKVTSPVASCSTEAKKGSISKANTYMAMLRASVFGKNTFVISGIQPLPITEVDVRFKKLDQLKSSNWEEVKVVPQKKNLRPAKPKPPVQSKLKEVIAARRKANKQVDICPDVESKTFEGGFLKVTSPVASCSTEAKKGSISKANTYMAMLRASVFGKNTSFGISGIQPLPATPTKSPIKLAANPARGILKSATNDFTKAKLSKKVCFEANQHVQETDSGVSSMETEIKLPNPEIVQSRKITPVRQDAFDIDDADISSSSSTNHECKLQRAAKIKALQAIEAKLIHKRKN